MFKKCLTLTQTFLFSRFCYLCEQALAHTFPLCRDCLRQLPILADACEQCGRKTYTIKSICGQCLKKPPPFSKMVACFTYQDPIKEMIHGYKFSQQLYWGPIFSQFLSHACKHRYKNDNWPEALLPLPLHHKRLKERGFNQSLEIAKMVSKRLACPLFTKAVERKKATVPQHQLPLKARQPNVNNAFDIPSHIHLPKHIAILDDVVTTGATVTALASALKKAGTQRVDIWCIARTMLSN